MNKLLVRLAGVWVGAGLVGGVYYRALTASQDFTGATQLSVVHTHSIALGAGSAMVFLLLNYVFGLQAKRSFGWAVAAWQSGVAITAITMALRGTWQIVGGPAHAAWLAGISGLGHMLIAAGFIALAVSLKGAVELPREATARA